MGNGKMGNLKRNEVMIMEAENKQTAADCHDVRSLLSFYNGVFEVPGVFQDPIEYKKYLEKCINRYLKGEDAKQIKEEIISIQSSLLVS